MAARARMRITIAVLCATALQSGCLENVTVGLENQPLVTQDAATELDAAASDAGSPRADAGPATDASQTEVDAGPCLPADCVAIALPVHVQKVPAACATDEAQVCERNSDGICALRCPAIPDDVACTGLQIVAECDPNSFCRHEVGDCDGLAGGCFERPSVCTADSTPVCGCDGVTYDSPCQAFANGINLRAIDACP